MDLSASVCRTETTKNNAATHAPLETGELKNDDIHDDIHKLDIVLQMTF